MGDSRYLDNSTVLNILRHRPIYIAGRLEQPASTVTFSKSKAMLAATRNFFEGFSVDGYDPHFRWHKRGPEVFLDTWQPRSLMVYVEQWLPDGEREACYYFNFDNWLKMKIIREQPKRSEIRGWISAWLSSVRNPVLSETLSSIWSKDRMQEFRYPTDREAWIERYGCHEVTG